jgi:uncharacterized membrane protein YvbJ
MYCPKCGQQNSDDARFCGKCGATMSAPPPPPAAPAHVHAHSGAPAAASPHATGVVSQGMRTGMIICSIVLPIVGIIVGVLFMLDANPEKKTAGKLWLIIGIVAGIIWTAILG